ncbi:MAG TPA: ModE family transcriptional regulator [Methylophilaceae bacterium]|jgi:molybdate transport system regulatory protein
MSSELLKIRISHGSETAMGPGKADLLDAIDQFGSISAAAKHMGMSYRRAWELVDTMNSCFDEPLVKTSPGGTHGGGAQITEFGFYILKCYRDLVVKTRAAAEREIAEFTSHLKSPD